MQLTTAARNAACNAVVALPDGNSGNGKLVIKAGSTVLATITLAKPSFGSASGGAATLLGVPLAATASAAGTADNYEIQDSAGTKMWGGTVGLSSADMIVDNTIVTNGAPVTVSAFTHTQPA